MLQYNDFNVSTNGFEHFNNDFVSMISHVLQHNDFHVEHITGERPKPNLYTFTDSATELDVDELMIILDNKKIFILNKAYHNYYIIKQYLYIANQEDNTQN